MSIPTRPEHDGPACVTVLPTEEETRAALDAYFHAQQTTRQERSAAAAAAHPALANLIDAMRQKTDQSHTLRVLLYSLWNGEPASLIEIVTLDWQLRKDLCAVLLGFGFEDMKDTAASFFYDAMQAALVNAGLFEWFTEESGVAA